MAKNLGIDVTGLSDEELDAKIKQAARREDSVPDLPETPPETPTKRGAAQPKSPTRKEHTSAALVGSSAMA